MYYTPFNSYQWYLTHSFSPYQYDNHERNNSSEKTINVDGTGIVKLEPDIVVLNIGVETTGNEVSTAQAENSRLVTSMLQAIKQMGVSEKDIGTSNYTITPEYDYAEGKQIFRGYRVTNTLNITIRDISMTGKIIDTAVRNGANKIDSINFTVSNPSPYIHKALSLAVRDSQEKAQTIANTLGVEMSIIPNSISEEFVSKPERSIQSAVYLASPKTPIEGGQLEITARIKAAFNYTSL